MAKHITSAIAALAVSAATIVAAQAADGRIRRECRASGGGEDISMSARYEKRDSRRKFSTEFEAAPGGRFKEGDRIATVVDGVSVGGVALEALVGGDLVADLNLDTKPQDDAVPFPSNWPGAGKGTVVSVQREGQTLLTCKLR